MAFDMKRTLEVADGKAQPMFRLYGWKPWAVSLGANQREENISIDECNNRGFDIVRRPTGGRAVLHADELTYSVVTNIAGKVTVHDVYREIHQILLYAFESLGCNDLEFQKSQPDLKEFYAKNDLSVSCFASSARYEIAWHGKKIVGSAQRLFGRTLLQHGSIPLGPGHEQLAYVINAKTISQRENLLQYTMKHSATISEICGRRISFEEAAEAVRKQLQN